MSIVNTLNMISQTLSVQRNLLTILTAHVNQSVVFYKVSLLKEILATIRAIIQQLQ